MESKTKLDPTDFHCKINTENDMRVSKLWHTGNFPFWVNYHFKFWEQGDKQENLVKVEGQGQNFPLLSQSGNLFLLFINIVIHCHFHFVF